MGGDYGPRVILRGVVQALPELSRFPGELILLGDEQTIQPLLKKRYYRALKEALEAGSRDQISPTEPKFKVRFLHAPQAIDMEESVRAVRSKPNATINIGCQLAAESYQSLTAHSNTLPTAFISAGHSGAVMTSALMHLGRLPSVERPAIAIKLPTLGKDGCVLLDVGANVDCKPENLRDFAIMGAIYASVERSNLTLPRVAILSNGEERKKGNELTRAARDLIEKLTCFLPGPQSIGKFVGYVEGKEIFQGAVDVLVTDGFVGNVVLKSLESLGSAVTTILKAEVKRNPLTILSFLFSAGVFARFKRRLDYAEYGAAPLLGVAGYVFVCHGRSNSKAIKNALLRVRTAMNNRFVERLQTILAGNLQPNSEVN